MWAAFLQKPGDLQYGLILIGATMMTGTVGPVATTVAEIAPPAARATALAVLALTQNLFGLAAGPLITGYLSDAYGLPFALLAIPVFSVPAAVAFLAWRRAPTAWTWRQPARSQRSPRCRRARHHDAPLDDPEIVDMRAQGGNVFTWPVEMSYRQPQPAHVTTRRCTLPAHSDVPHRMQGSSIA